ncbi:MAG: hypothetical protein MJ176_00620 [Treponema sp.]|nr:hypothetical protein [Treponema sp.]
MTILTSTGYGCSGSSAATDFFSEFNNVQVVPNSFECTFLHETDGLYDLEKAVEEGHRLKVDLAVKRFIALSEEFQKSKHAVYFGGHFLEYTYRFLEKVVGCKWNGWWHRAFETSPLTKKQQLVAEVTAKKYSSRVKSSSYALFENDSWMPSYLPPSTQYYECDLENFRKEAKTYVMSLMNLLNKGNKDFLLVDQLLPPIHAERYFHYFDDIKVIVVDRDPRDYFLCNNLFWVSRFIPSENTATYISWYKKTRLATEESNCLKRVYLEELIYNYEKTTDELREFAGLKESDQTEKGLHLVPEKSRRNTRLFEKYTDYSEDVKLISSELSSWLFDYSKADSALMENLGAPVEIPRAMDILLECDEYYRKQKISMAYVVLALKKEIYSILRPVYRKVKKICQSIR